MCVNITINLIQDLATPHNNLLISELVGLENVKVNLWYADSEDSMYEWSYDITNQHAPATIYGKGLNLSFLRYCISAKEEIFFIVGWLNINTILLHILFLVLRRPYNHWTDRPQPILGSFFSVKKIRRWLGTKILQFSNCKIFGVGITSLNYFLDKNLPSNKLVNLPISVSVDDIGHFHSKRTDLLKSYNVPEEGYLLSAGSRLIFSKGFDLLLQAFANIPLELRRKTVLVIVGKGEEMPLLEQMVSELRISESVVMEKWLDIDDFRCLIANSDIFVHPARFDAYGGTALSMALNTPTIGSTGSGAAVDRIQHGINGLLYEATDTQALASHITELLSNSDLRKRIGDAGRETAKEWAPRRCADILVKNVI